MKLAQEQLDALAKRLEQSVRAAKNVTVFVACSAEEAIALRVRRIEARATLMRAKAKATRAQSAAASKEFERADQLLAEASDLLRDARETLGDDHAYDAKLDAIKSSLREAVNAVRTQ